MPPKPNDVTPASAGPKSDGHGAAAVCTRSGSASKGIWGLGSRKCRLGNSSRCLSARATLIKPAIPAAASRWPILVLTEPSAQRRPAWTIDGEHRAERLGLDRIAQESACAMRLNVLNAARRNAGSPIRFAQDGFLGERIRRHQAVAPSVLVHRAAANYRVNRIAFGQRFRERLQNDDACALTANVAVGSRIESLAAPVGSHHAGLAEIDGDRRGKDQIHASGQCERGLSVPEAAAGQMDRDQRRRAGGVDRDARSAKIKQVREAIGGDAQCIAGARVSVDPTGIAQLNPAVVVVGDTDEDAGLGAGQALSHLSAIFQVLPRRPRATGVAADPFARLRAARCRRNADRTGPPARGSRPIECLSCPELADPDRKRR